MNARENLIRDLANRRLAAIGDLVRLRPDQSAILADEVFAEAAWYVDVLLPLATTASPLAPLSGHNGAPTGAASLPELPSPRGNDRSEHQAGQGTSAAQEVGR